MQFALFAAGPEPIAGGKLRFATEKRQLNYVNKKYN